MVVLLSRTMGCYINPALSRRLRAGHTGCLSLLPSHSDGIKMIFAPTVQTWVEGLFHSQKKSQKVPSLLENWISVESEVGPRTDQDFTSKTKNISKRPLEVSSLPNSERQTCIHVFSCSAARDSCCSQNKSRLTFYWCERAIGLLLYEVVWHGEVHSRNLVFCMFCHSGLLFSFCFFVPVCAHAAYLESLQSFLKWCPVANSNQRIEHVGQREGSAWRNGYFLFEVIRSTLLPGIW